MARDPTCITTMYEVVEVVKICCAMLLNAGASASATGNSEAQAGAAVDTACLEPPPLDRNVAIDREQDTISAAILLLLLLWELLMELCQSFVNLLK